MKPTLSELAVKYSSDKWFWHSYISSGKYEELFAGLEVKRLLEVGIGYKDLMQPFLPEGVEYVHGSSVKMWEEYFPEADIVACDIREDALINEGRIRSMVCDQSNWQDLEKLLRFCGGWPDVIIDDGSHDPAHQMFTGLFFVPFMPKGTTYIIEDVWPAQGNDLAAKFNGLTWRGEKGRDDNMVVIQR